MSSIGNTRRKVVGVAAKKVYSRAMQQPDLPLPLAARGRKTRWPPQSASQSRHWRKRQDRSASQQEVTVALGSKRLIPATYCWDMTGSGPKGSTPPTSP